MRFSITEELSTRGSAYRKRRQNESYPSCTPQLLLCIGEGCCSNFPSVHVPSPNPDQGKHISLHLAARSRIHGGKGRLYSDYCITWDCNNPIRLPSDINQKQKTKYTGIEGNGLVVISPSQ